MKLSIIIPVLNSHEVLRRQFIHFENIGIPEDTEIIIVDDGSDPPLKYNGNLPVVIHATNDKRPWTWALARNVGARLARGEYLFMFDVDHIIKRDAIDMARTFGGDKIHFDREFAILRGDGSFSQDIKDLVNYGFPLDRVKERSLRIPPLPNNFVMKKDIFWSLGGYREDLVSRPYPQGEDRLFKKKWIEATKAGLVMVHNVKGKMYMFPNGYYIGDVDANPFGLFHSLSRKTNSNFKYKKQIKTGIE